MKIKYKYLKNLNESFDRRISLLKIRLSKGLEYTNTDVRREWREEIKILYNLKERINDAIKNNETKNTQRIYGRNKKEDIT